MEYLTIQATAARLGVSRPTVYKLIKSGEIKVKRIVGRPAITEGEIERYQQRSKPVSQQSE